MYEIHSSKYYGVKPGDVNPDFIDFDMKMQEGYGYFKKEENVKAIELWQKIFIEMKKYFEEHEIGNLQEFDEIFMGNEYASNWVLDYDEALMVAIKKSSAKDKYRLGAQRIALVKFLLEIDMSSEHEHLESIRALAETHYMLGDYEKGEELFKGLIDDNPDFVWGYIGYSDQYWLEDEENMDYGKAMKILKKAFYKEKIDEVDVVIRRMADLQIRIEKDKLERFLKMKNEGAVPEGTDAVDIFERIRKTKDILPLPQLEYVNAHKSEFVHLALAEMGKYAKNPVDYADDNYFFALYIPMLLGQWEVKEASRYLIDLVACTDEVIDRTVGDMITDCYSVVLYKCFDGDTEYLKGMIEKDGISEFSQMAFLLVLSVSYVFDENDLHKLKDYLERLLVKRPDFATLIADNIMAHRRSELLPLAEKCINSEYYDPQMYGEWKEYMFHFNGSSEIETDKFETEFDLIDELSGWYYFTSTKPAVSGYSEVHTELIKDRERMFPDAKKNQKAAKGRLTVVKGIKTGRNDPCPCGSGKKYKYCCLNKKM